MALISARHYTLSNFVLRATHDGEESEWRKSDLRLVLEEGSDDDFDSGSSADEEAELERQLGIFDDTSR